MSQEELFINGDLLRLGREAKGWVLNDMATRACMSIKQIRQLEEGGMSAFYSEAVKATAAKKVAALLGVSADDVFAKPSALNVGAESASTEIHLPVPVIAIEPQADVSALDLQAHEVPIDTPESAVKQEHSHESSNGVEPKSKTSLLTIAALFAVALAAAAYLQPKEDTAVEAAPPVQVLPAEAIEPASAASAADAVASGVDVAASASAVPIKPASVASGTAAVASMPRAAASVASVPIIARPASAVAAPAAPAASKAP
jgi:cytoskeleton protein RodZ